MKILTRYFQYFQFRESIKLRSSIGMRFTVEADTAVASGSRLQKAAEDRIWSSIERSLPFTPSSQPQLTQKIDRWSHLRLAALPLTGLVVLSLIVALYMQTSSGPMTTDYDGIKGSQVTQPVLKSLRFAVLQPDGQTTTGESHMIVEKGNTLIFFAEADGVSEEQPLPVTLAYHRHGDKETVKIIDAKMTENRQVLSGQKGYIAFTPESEGTYRIILMPNLKNTKPEAGDVNAAEVTFKIVDHH